MLFKDRIDLLRNKLFHLLRRPDQHLPCTCVCTGIQQPNRIRDFEQEHGEIDLRDASTL